MKARTNIINLTISIKLNWSLPFAQSMLENCPIHSFKEQTNSAEITRHLLAVMNVALDVIDNDGETVFFL